MLYEVSVAGETYRACPTCSRHLLALCPSAWADPVQGDVSECELRYDGKVTCDDRA